MLRCKKSWTLLRLKERYAKLKIKHHEYARDSTASPSSVRKIICDGKVQGNCSSGARYSSIAESSVSAKVMEDVKDMLVMCSAQLGPADGVDEKPTFESNDDENEKGIEDEDEGEEEMEVEAEDEGTLDANVSEQRATGNDKVDMQIDRDKSLQQLKRLLERFGFGLNLIEKESSSFASSIDPLRKRSYEDAAFVISRTGSNINGKKLIPDRIAAATKSAEEEIDRLQAEIDSLREKQDAMMNAKRESEQRSRSPK